MTAPVASSPPLADRIASRLDARPVPGVPELRLLTAHPGSRLADLATGGGAPYWAWPWGGGIALARYILDRPETVRGRRVLDIGAGSGLVAIAAALGGAQAAAAVDADRAAIAAIGLNAALNGVSVVAAWGDATEVMVPGDVDLILAGDVFYDAAVAARMTRFLTRCLAAGLPVLVGDPFRADLPLPLLAPVARYDVRDFGDAAGATRPAGVFAFRGVPAGT